ncbi:chromosome segregation protein SMC [Tepidibacter hydrothermalis]|uniref:Chromosome partition protein Smc n=1 Tax=Tepidibacter hydrothermalis TaxID=3036126 RepID=A0ABY8EBK5_9FIRM|nr:chromosome segregation protein SMC [Tepidibacter hydrothermalis]WFD08974.1 chromosome segregation protein SMC [Tepidibacter hydrothermalis]
MYLKRLELKGFKSFPNKTDIIFEKGITSIVGPNGSGKSNVLDAIRWVLGEQSIKSLRGDKLEDVIFIGADNKKPMNYCEVALIIDNSENIINIDYSEVSIKRRAYRSGESEFYINNKACRLKDVKELLLDTGIGREGYSIIEQGKIDEILGNNVNNRRKVFDEACGISKYRYKKQEGEKNLKNTKENLERINDIFYEIENQLKPLEIQKDKSLKYIKLSDELKVLQVNSYIREIETLDVELKEINNHSNILSEQLVDLEKTKKSQEAELIDIEKKLDGLEIKITESNESIHQVQGAIDKKIADLNLIDEKINNIQINKQRNEKELSELKSKKIKKEEELNSLIDDSDKLFLNLENLNKSKTSIKGSTDKGMLELNSIEQRIEDLKNDAINLLDEKNNKNIRLSSLNTNVENIQNRKIEVRQNIDEISLQIEEKKVQLQNGLEIEKKNNDIIQSLRLNKKEEINSLNSSIANLKNIESSINNKKLKINEYKSKLNVYVDMENRYEGFYRGVKEVLKNKKLPGIKGAVAEVIKVDKEYEVAVEVAMGSSLQNVITKDEYSAKQAISYLKQGNLGRVTFLPMNIIKSRKVNIKELPSMDGLIGIASDIVKFEDEFKNIIENILGRTILVDDIDCAIKLGKMTNYKYRIVTLKGDIFNAGGSLTGGSVKSVNNLLSRKRIIEEFKENIEKEKVEIQNLLENKVNTEQELETKRNNISNLEVSIQEKEKIIFKINSDINNIKEDIDLIQQTKVKLEKEESGFNDNLSYTNELINKLNEEIKEIDIKTSEIEQTIKDIEIKKQEYKQKYESDIKILNEVQLEIAKYTQIYENNQNQIQISKDYISDLKNNIAIKEEEIKNAKLEEQNVGEKKILIKVEKEELNEQMVDINKKYEDYKNDKLNILKKIKDKKEDFKAKEENYIQLKESAYKIESKIDKLEVSQDNYFNKLWEDYELTFKDAIHLKNDELEIDKKNIENLKNQIKRIGNVNLDSIKEYKEVKERHDFYEEQKKDLEKSIESIEKLIVDLECNMRSEFSANFEKINEYYMVIYKKLFGGGYGELKIVDPSNILQSDIEIIAQPPGKKLKNINLLSGGEKALTAIAILFSIISTRPTPFCVLDEIEAPLDDANIYRYGEFLKDLAKDTQFIAITHRRGTMQVSDYIYGVTMEQKAISKVISLKLEQAQELTNENAS